jgi:hypothetical protein
MGISVGPRQAGGGMLPRGFVMGGARQGTTISRNQFPRGAKGDDAYNKAVAEEAAKEKRFFDENDRWRQAMKPFWMR